MWVMTSAMAEGAATSLASARRSCGRRELPGAALFRRTKNEVLKKNLLTKRGGGYFTFGTKEQKEFAYVPVDARSSYARRRNTKFSLASGKSESTRSASARTAAGRNKHGGLPALKRTAT